MSSLFPFSGTPLYADVHQSIMKFLNPRDKLVNYAPVSHMYAGRVDTLYKKAVTTTTMQIASHVANEFFTRVGGFSKVNELIVKGGDFTDLVKLDEARTIKILSFDSDSKITSPQLLLFLKAVPNLQRLSLNGGTSQSHSKPIEVEGHSDAAKNNLDQLSELDLSWSDIDAQVVLEILQKSTNFRSVDLSHLDGLSDATFVELARSKGLTHLNLSGISPSQGGLNYGILASCTSLESFTPSKHISEEALISIIQANPNLKHLNLSECPAAVCTGRVLQILAAKSSLESFTPNKHISEDALIAIIRSNPNLTHLELQGPVEAVTDRVLQTIAAHLPRLEKIVLKNMQKITGKGFCSLVQGCKELRSIELGGFKQISTVALSELKKCSSLRELKIGNSTLVDEFFDTLESMTGLTTLSIRNCKGFEPQRLSKIQSLINLEYLELYTAEDIDDIFKGIIGQCPKLQKLSIGRVGNIEKTLDVIREALRETCTELRDLEIFFKSTVSYSNEEAIIDMQRQLKIDFPQLESCNFN